MGYFLRGLVFTQEPNWSGLRSLADYQFRGYKHKALDVWLLDEYSGESPFCGNWGSDASDEREALSTPGPDAFLGTLEKAMPVVESNRERLYGLGWLPLTRKVAAAAGVDGFFFTWDDEFYDAAWLCNADGRTVDFALRAGDECYFSYRRGRLSVTIPRPDRESYGDDFEEALSDCKTLKSSLDPIDGLSVKIAAVDRCVHYNALQRWPKAAGDPETTLGVGTWDALENLERDYDHVYKP